MDPPNIAVSMIAQSCWDVHNKDHYFHHSVHRISIGDMQDLHNVRISFWTMCLLRTQQLMQWSSDAIAAFNWLRAILPSSVLLLHAGYMHLRLRAETYWCRRSARSTWLITPALEMRRMRKK
jgi:hypothetical protein